MKITTVYLPMCLGFILSRAWRHDDTFLIVVAVIAIVLDVVLVCNGVTE